MIAENKLAEIAGAGNVIRKKSVLEEYSRDMSFANTIRPEYVVKVRNCDDVKQIVNLARQTLPPLVPVSSGPPHLRGDTVPGMGGAIIIDLSGMKDIIRVDRQNRVAMFEAGVTFEELIPAAAKEGLRLNMPLQPRKTKSVLGSILEREPVIMPKYQWDIADPLACTEIIFGTGDMFRTGAAAGSGTLEEQWAAGGAQKEGAGPSATSLYRVIQGSQGTMGIVTWASTRCELLPKLEEPYLVGATQLDRLLDMVHWLIRLRLANECFILNNTSTAGLVSKSTKDAGQIRDSLPPWLLLYNIAAYEYFPEERMTGQTKDMKDVAQRIGVEPVKALGKVSAWNLLEASRHPSKDKYWKLSYKGGCQDVFFLSIYDKLVGFIKTMHNSAEAVGYPITDIGIYLQPLVQGTSCHCEFNLFYNPENSAETDRVRKLSDTAVKDLLDKGAFFSRPYGENAAMIVNRDAANVTALKKVKSILDPDNIMNPGKLCF